MAVPITTETVLELKYVYNSSRMGLVGITVVPKYYTAQVLWRLSASFVNLVVRFPLAYPVNCVV